MINLAQKYEIRTLLTLPGERILNGDPWTLHDVVVPADSLVTYIELDANDRVYVEFAPNCTFVRRHFELTEFSYRRRSLVERIARRIRARLG